MMLMNVMKGILSAPIYPFLCTSYWQTTKLKPSNTLTILQTQNLKCSTFQIIFFKILPHPSHSKTLPNTLVKFLICTILVPLPPTNWTLNWALEHGFGTLVHAGSITEFILCMICYTMVVHCQKYFRYAFGLGKRDPYAFGLGKRDPYAFGLGKRDPYAFGLGKRDPYSFGLGRKWSVTTTKYTV